VHPRYLCQPLRANLREHVWKSCAGKVHPRYLASTCFEVGSAIWHCTGKRIPAASASALHWQRASPQTLPARCKPPRIPAATASTTRTSCNQVAHPRCDLSSRGRGPKSVISKQTALGHDGWRIPAASNHGQCRGASGRAKATQARCQPTSPKRASQTSSKS